MTDIEIIDDDISIISQKKRKLDDLETDSAKTVVQSSNFLTLFEPIQSRTTVQFEEIRKKDLHLSYCEKFLPKSVADALLRYCERNILYQDKTEIQVYGNWHTIPRKQTAYGDDGVFYGFSGTKVSAEKWPKELEELKKYVSKVVGIDFNFVLVNRYADGNDHIGEHRDDEKELDPQSCIASLSIGQTRDFVLRHETRVRKQQLSADEKTIPENVSLQLRHGSLLMMRPPTNKYWYHSLPIRKKALGVRINFTFRKVLKG